MVMLHGNLFLSFFVLCVGIQAQQLDPTLLVQVHGEVVDANTDQLLQASIYVLAPDTTNELAVTDTNTEGHFGLALQRGSSYDIKVELEGYETFERRLDLTAQGVKQMEFNIRMKRSNTAPRGR